MIIVGVKENGYLQILNRLNWWVFVTILIENKKMKKGMTWLPFISDSTKSPEKRISRGLCAEALAVELIY